MPHQDWTTLCHHLCREFGDVAPAVVARELGAAKDATTHVGLDAADALEMGEVIARHQLMLLTGRAT